MLNSIAEKTTKQVLVIIFLVTGILLMGFRWLYINTEQNQVPDTVWRITIAGQFEVEKDSTVISVARPKTGNFVSLISQRFYHPGFTLLRTRTSTANQVRVKANKTGSAEFLTEYHFRIHQTARYIKSKGRELTVAERKQYLGSNDETDLALSGLAQLHEYISSNVTNKSQLLSEIYRYSQHLLKSKKTKYSELEKIVQSNKATNLGRARLMVALCRLSDFPARLVTGFILDESIENNRHYWVEVYDEVDSWKKFDPEKGYEGSVPENYIAFGYDNPEIFSIDNGKPVTHRFSVFEDIDASDLSLFEQEQIFTDIFDLRRLDLDNKQTIAKLLVLPFCVLLTVFFRHVLGFFPYGTFTAPLLALAMVYAEPVITLTVSGVVITLALIGRSILPKSLPRSPRLSLIFTFVSMSMVLSISLLSYFSISTSGGILLIPTIILVSIVDRFYSYMDEAGKRAALVRLGVTVLIAMFCIPLLKIEFLGDITLVYPEILFIIAALVLILSSYKGSKLTDNKYLALFGVNKQKKAQV